MRRFPPKLDAVVSWAMAISLAAPSAFAGTPAAALNQAQSNALASTPQQTPASQPPPAPQAGTPAPVGTAAAPVIRAGGISASRPAGAAIAPAKQGRRHSYALRVGLIVGAAVAVGAVTAASLGSSAKPH